MAKQQHLLELLQQAGQELSGQELHARLRGSPQAMGLATVYRHLRQLQQRGLLRCRHLPSGEALFSLAERDEHHLTCVDCGRTQPLAFCPMHDLQLEDDQLQGFKPLFHTLEFFGHCPDCRTTESPAAGNVGGESRQRECAKAHGST
jgi:Fur family transcriptional regulator, ferric uptake regulator